MTLGDLLNIAHEVPGRVRFRVRGRPSRSLLAAIEQTLDAAPGVRRVRVNEAAASVVAEFDPTAQSSRSLLDLPYGAEAGDEPLARIDESIVLRASPQAIWALLDRFQGVPSDGGMIAVQATGPASWSLSLTLLGQELQLRMVRTEEVPAERLVFRLDVALQGRCVFTMAQEEGGTRVREQVSYTLGNAIVDRTLGALIEPILRHLAREQLDAARTALRQPPEGVSDVSA